MIFFVILNRKKNNMWKWNKYDRWYLWPELWMVAAFIGFLCIVFMLLSRALKG